MPAVATTLKLLNLSGHSYPIVTAHEEADKVGPFTRQLCKGVSAFLVTDQNVTTHAEQIAKVLSAAGFHTEKVVLTPGESQKTLASAEKLYDRLQERHADRSTLVVAVGGGVVGDLAGFVAATYARGLPWLVVPTTLLAMVDSAIGGKVAVNHPKAKNLIGAFHQPVGVWIDIAALRTLPEREFRSGLAEVVKYGVIMDADLFAFLEQHADDILKRKAEVLLHIISRCCRLKANVVEKDEREETGVRAILNYGHTFAHAFEAVAGYGSWLHGEAVAAGMICASRLAERRGDFDAELTQRQRRLLKKFGLPIKPDKWNILALISAMRSDKKAVAGKLRLILPTQLGSVSVANDASESEVAEVLEKVMNEPEA